MTIYIFQFDTTSVQKKGETSDEKLFKESIFRLRLWDLDYGILIQILKQYPVFVSVAILTKKIKLDINLNKVL